MIVIEFISEFDQYKAGDIVPIERTLAMRLIGIGKARRPAKEPKFKEPVRTGAKIEPVRKEDIKEEPEEKPKKKKTVKKSGRPKKSKQIETAVIE